MIIIAFNLVLHALKRRQPLPHAGPKQGTRNEYSNTEGCLIVDLTLTVDLETSTSSACACRLAAKKRYGCQSGGKRIDRSTRSLEKSTCLPHFFDWISSVSKCTQISEERAQPGRSAKGKIGLLIGSGVGPLDVLRLVPLCQ